MPPTLAVCNADSLAEQIQRAFPDCRVAKALSTMNAELMIDPGRLPGDHDVFVCGDDADAKHAARRLLGEFGWGDDQILDIGGIEAARGPEMYFALWASWATFGTADFNIDVVRRVTR